MEIRVLGPLGLSDDGRQVPIGGRRQRAVLAGLLLADGDPVSTVSLVDFVWGDDPPPTARKSLQTYVSRLRRLLGDEVIQASSDGYRLAVESVDVDAHRFAGLAERGRRLLSTDSHAAFEALNTALGLWRGSPLSDVDAHGELIAHVERLREARLAAIEDRIEAGLALGRHGELVGDLQSLVEANPLRERLWGQLMLALYRSGRQAEALRAFQRCRQVLGEELGIEPSLSLRRLEERILEQDPALEVAPTPGMEDTGAPGRNPYKGLRAFSDADADDFFGREALVDDLMARIDAGDRFLALIGPSGSGKSSVALAGLIPAIRHDAGPRRWVAKMTPGTHPFTQLESALSRLAGGRPISIAPADRLALLRTVLTILPDDGRELVLIIDQFEELLTGSIPDAEVDHFVSQISEAVEDPYGRLTVVVTLRADFFDQALRHGTLADLLSAGAVNVPPLSAVEVQAAITRPALSAGLEIEPDLTAELVTETANHPGSLPLLQFVLTDLTDRAPGKTLTLAALQQAGGIRGTLAKRAEELFASLSPPEQGAARRVFLRLVALNEDGEPTRRVVPVDDLRHPDIDVQVLRRAVDALAEGRLLTLGQGPGGHSTVEVAHEAVFREWPRCARWVEEARSDIRLAGEWERTAADWAAAQRSPDYLATGSRLRLFEEWASRSEVGMSAAAARFLEASIQRRREEEERESARAERERLLERRSVNRLRLTVGVLALLALLTTTLSVFANRQREAALSGATEILVRQLSNAAFAQVGRDPELSLLLALHAVRVSSTMGEALPLETIEALHWGLQQASVQYPVADGEILGLVGPGGTRGAYHLPVDELVGLARSRVSRQLTADECERFLSSGECPELPADLVPEGLRAEEVPVGDAAALEGTTVRIASLLTGSDLVGYRDEFEVFREGSGIEVTLTEHSNLESAMAAGEIQDETDIIITAQPGAVRTEAAAGRLMDLGRYLSESQIVSDYGEYLTSWASVESGAGGRTLHAVPLDAHVKGLIWYSPERFAAAGYDVPTTWAELIELSDRIVADGGSPWCFAEENETASGWPGTDWVEDILLLEHGPEVYDAWVAGDVAFSDPRVRSAFERLGQIFFADGYVNGGVNTALTTSYFAGALPLLDDPPGCWLHHQASFMANHIPTEIEPGRHLSAFFTPPIREGPADSLLMGGLFALVYGDRPEVRAVVRYMASPDFGSIAFDHLPGAFAVNRRFDLGSYPEQWRRAVAATLARAQADDRVRFDGSDLMPLEIGTYGFWSAMLEYYRGGPDALDGILARLDQLRADLRE